MNLLSINDPEIIQKTALSRKLTIGGKTTAFPVYRVRLDQLYYNDQNDRIATWITQYNNDSGRPFSDLSREEYNEIVERFIIESNPSALEKTKMNIALVSQREPGVVLSDGRIIDGNRRFTCLRLLQRENREPHFFETVILEGAVENDRKLIKMLELSIQHGEEQRVDYNLIDLAVGTYHDIVETGLLTIEEYSDSTNESPNEIKRRLATAELIIEFLDYMKVPKQYHIAREMGVYSLFYELVPLLRKCDTVETRQKLKNSVFCNAMMHSFADQRKYIRDVKSMMESGLFDSYIKKQTQIVEDLELKKEDASITNKADLDRFANENSDTTEELQISMDRTILQSKRAQARSKPHQIVSKSLSMLMDVDTRVIDRMSDEEKEKLGSQLKKLTEAAVLIKQDVDETISTDNSREDPDADSEGLPEETPRLEIRVAERHPDEPFVYCSSPIAQITNLVFSLTFSAVRLSDEQSDSADYLALFVDEAGNEISSIVPFVVHTGTNVKVSFCLNSTSSQLNTCFLVLRSAKDAYGEAQLKMRFPVQISFQADADF